MKVLNAATALGCSDENTPDVCPGSAGVSAYIRDGRGSNARHPAAAPNATRHTATIATKRE